MPRILILHSTHDGQAQRIAGRIADALSQAGHVVHVRPADAIGVRGQVESHDAVIVGGSVRFGRHARALEQVVRAHADALARRPGAFFSVCPAAGGPRARPAEAQRRVDRFLRETGWRPGLAASFAGALPYRRYNFVVRRLVQAAMAMSGGETDASRDHEYTDWQAVDSFAAEFAQRLGYRRAA